MHQLKLYRSIWQNLASHALLLCSLLLTTASMAQATDYPNKPIRFIVAFPAGSATDQVARLVAHQMTKATGQSIVVENRGGANGFIASEAVAKAPADGYTVLLTTGTTHAANPALFKNYPTTRSRISHRSRHFPTTPLCWWWHRTFRPTVWRIWPNWLKRVRASTALPVATRPLAWVVKCSK